MVLGRPSFTGSRRIAIVLVLFTFSLATYGCGAPPSAGAVAKDGQQAHAPQPWDDLTGNARENALLNAAKKEGTLSVYSSYNDEPSMAKAFTAKYGIKVDVYQANSESILQRVLQETTAGRLGNDVLISPGPDMEAIDTIVNWLREKFAGTTPAGQVSWSYRSTISEIYDFSTNRRLH
jgi:iron(III) transport system substrate-binding protein